MLWGDIDYYHVQLLQLCLHFNQRGNSLLFSFCTNTNKLDKFGQIGSHIAESKIEFNYLCLNNIALKKAYGDILG